MNWKTLHILFLIFSIACSRSAILPDEEIDMIPEIFPDYTDCTIPPNIAPLNFRLINTYDAARIIFKYNNESWEVNANKKQFSFPISRWRKMLHAATGKSINVKILIKTENKWKGYRSFSLQVAKEPIDSHIAYRLIEPGYQLWNQMGIYQRDLENYKETPIMENKLSNKNCMNCHSFCMQDPNRMLFHMRGPYNGTYLLNGGKVEKLNTKTEQTMSALVYPSWHPSGRYVAFSVNNTQQAFHMNDLNRVEVYDTQSDVVVYDVEKHEIITTPQLFSEERFETFPTFSPDGRTLYYCSATSRTYPTEFEEVKYSLYAINFNPGERSFSTVIDTLYNAEKDGKSVSFPRVSPDGKYLLYTLSDYGTFSIWHKEADLYMTNLTTKDHYPLKSANSDQVESYHSWSSNSRWVIFSSRRLDGLYTRPYITYINDRGETEKPFLLPQRDTEFYQWFMKSYNIPEFITGPVKDQRREIRTESRKEGTNVHFVR